MTTLIEHHIKCLALNKEAPWPLVVQETRDLIKAWRKEQHGNRHLCLVGCNDGRSASAGGNVGDSKGESR